MFRKILLYGLPLYLYGLELLLRAIANSKGDSVAGPTLAGAGIGFLLPLTELKRIDLDPELSKALEAHKARAYSPRDKSFSELVWLAFFLSLAAWMYSLYLILPSHSVPSVVNWSLVIGGVIFAVSILMAEVKERI